MDITSRSFVPVPPGEVYGDCSRRYTRASRGAVAVISPVRERGGSRPMTTTSGTPFEQLLSSRAALGRPGTRAGGPPAPSGQGPIYEFGGGRPDPASFPYQGIVAATAEVSEVEGADAP